MKDRLIIIPSYNERRNLDSLLPRLEALRDEWDAIIIDDGSTDGTAEWLSKHQVPHLRLPFNMGIGGAMHAGYVYAAKKGYRLALQMDGDGQHPPEEVRHLVEALKETGADMIIGSRFVGESGYRAGPSRRIGIRLFEMMIRHLTGATITDATSGFRLANSRVIALFAQDYPSDYPEVESVVQILLAGYRVIETPTLMNSREHGRSTIGTIRSIYYMIKVPLAIILRVADTKGRKPLCRESS